MESLDAKLFQQRIGQRRPQRVRSQIYADKSWVEDLDIINELGGHTGCVNALSWSSGGGLLASGSDDTYLNIWGYNPTNLAKPFTLNTSVSTGHTANIFSVKFMPHSSDRIVVTCAGDSEVRVFDLEHSGANRDGAAGDTTSSSTRSRRFNNFFGSARWLSDANTNARVYRSHSDRAKRIVTESSPHLFLSCSEDGEVRQWDLRQPSSYYPPPRGMRRLGRFRTTYNDETSGRAPPPLISYKRYQLDLNSISCSASQPHYIALGGAHMHCFLHDRRMLGRDIAAEHGRPGEVTSAASIRTDEVMREATKCVRRFAPNNKRRMKPHDTGHITACKISDARPNELISSWSGDHIYSFDIVKSPDARDTEARAEKAAQDTRLRHRADRKRKRMKQDGSTNSPAATSRRQLRRVSDKQQETGQTALRVRYENGETQDISLDGTDSNLNSSMSAVRDSLLSEAQKQAERIAKSLVRLRKTLFDFSTALLEQQVEEMESSSELTPFTHRFTDALGQAASLLPQMDDIMRSWSYPVNPAEDEVEYQNTLRRNRQASWRFVQATGCLAVTLGAKLQTPSAAKDPRSGLFDMVKPALREGRHLTSSSRFCYDLLKAILLWIDGGAAAVLKGFKKPPDMSGESPRFPLGEEDTIETLPDKLGDYFVSLADETQPIIDLGTSRFERDELRNIFDSQKAAVQAFIRALAGIELHENQGLSEVVADASTLHPMRKMNKGAAARFWVLKVGKSLLMEAAKGVNYSFVQHAFGGPKVHIISDYENLGHLPHEISSEDDEQVIEAVDFVRQSTAESSLGTLQPDIEADAEADAMSTNIRGRIATRSDAAHENDENLLLGGERDSAVNSDWEDDVDDDEDGDDAEDFEDEDEHEDDNYPEESEEEDIAQPLYRSRPSYGRSSQRVDVNLDVHYSSHTKVYKGHCNTRTVKDVNYFGLDDEYVVSGSDDGHFFIWDRKTCQIVNILEGDGEVVNVVQGHPYEPIIACSGIDSSVKIFGPGSGSRDRRDALRGVNVANPGEIAHSSLRYSARSRQTRSDSQSDNGDEMEVEIEADTFPETGEDPPAGPNGLRSRRAMDRCYEITSQNDAMRRDGVGDAIMTEGMLARLAAALQRNELHGIAGQGFGGQGGTIVLDDNCSVM